MERFCSTCGGFVKGDVKFCPNCGAAMASAVDLGKSEPTYANDINVGETSSRSVPGLQAPAYDPNAPRAPQAPADEVMSMGKWLLTIFLTTCLGTVSLVLTIIWGFAVKNVPANKRNYCRAMLLFNIITTVAAMIFTFVFVGAVLNSPEIQEIIKNALEDATSGISVTV